MIVRNMRAISDHASRDTSENRVSFAHIAIASTIAHIVCVPSIRVQTIPLPRRLVFTKRGPSNRLIFRPLEPQARRRVCCALFRRPTGSHLA